MADFVSFFSFTVLGLSGNRKKSLPKIHLAMVSKLREFSRGTFCLLTLLHFYPAHVHGCTACMGASNSPLGEAANGAIFVMLGVLGLVLGLISLVGYSLVRRARLPIPPHQELVRSISESNLNEV